MRRVGVAWCLSATSTSLPPAPGCPTAGGVDVTAGALVVPGTVLNLA
jgi:hypothetical protein